jgi:hypothetical protein
MFSSLVIISCLRSIPSSALYHSIPSSTGCCINRSQLSYGLTGLALIRADGAQPSLHLDEYVFVPYIYGLVALLESTIKASSNQYFNTGTASP